MSDGIERIGWAVRVERHDRGNRWPAVGWSKNAAHREAEAWADDGYEAEAMPLYAAPEGHIESLEAERDELRHEVTTLNEMGADLTRERDELRATVERYREALESIIERTEDYDDGDWGFEGMPGDTVAGIDNAARRALNPGESHEQD